MTKTASKWIRTAADQAAVDRGCFFDLDRGMHVVEFFRKFLCHSKGKWANKPFELLEWQQDDVILPLFGWIQPDGTRRFRKAFIEIPKKQGKSTIAAGVGLYLLTADGEDGAEVYSTATDREQASIVHGEAIRMVESSPALNRALNINRTTRAILYERTKSTYRALSADARNKEGYNIHGAINDELHVWQGRTLYDTLRYGYAARSQPLEFNITTAGADLQSVCRELYEYAKGVLDGSILDDSFFPYVREAAPEDDWTDPKTWHKANPSLGITTPVDEMARAVEEAKVSPSAEAAFKRYRLNIWTTGENPWLRLDDWQACRRDFTDDDLLGQECYGGLDLAKTRDTTSLVLNFPKPNGTSKLLAFFWLPEDTAREAKGVPYTIWARSGFIELTEGNVCDYDRVFDRINALSRRYKIKKIAFDPYNAEQLTQKVEAELGIPRLEFGQRMSNFAGPTAEFERRILSRQIHHNGHPILGWQAGNAKVISDANGNRRPVKPKPDDPRKIDGVVAAVMALAVSMTAVPKRSIYETRGLAST